MADRIEIETSLLAQDKDTIQGEIQSLKTYMTQMREQMEQLSGMWEGPAKEAFMNQFWSDFDYIQSFFDRNGYIYRSDGVCSERI